MSTPQTPSAPIRGPEFWRRTFCYVTGLGLSPEDRAAYEADNELRKEQDECRRCEKNRDYLLRYSPIVRFMLKSVQQVGGDLSAENIKCLPCDGALRTGGFSPQYGIMLCQNRLDRGRMEDTLAHEMVHAYDHLRFNVNWDDLKHHACSEIRASSLSGECRWTREAFTRGVWDFTQQHQACVRRRATISVSLHPKCKDDAEAAKIVDMVFDSCFADTRPFSDIYR
ncbi:uncharacterized protein LAJ45_05580 [Morchella importuna]|uniref:uncharacterized protein n=1 Tax=Morchella importuna TaxID=1174673 RepID=UPI001E8ED6AE|nr:uncharacterized protein LAJ45_05580 [Morchella importuna]KAH8150369.1 hypothetical protein LAJ45_05580 [Morchella importuna]